MLGSDIREILRRNILIKMLPLMKCYKIIPMRYLKFNSVNIEYWDDEDVQAMCQSNSENRKKQKWRHRMGPINFVRVRVALRATKENNEEPSNSEMFITTRTKKGKEVHTDTQVAISELQNRQSSGETADDAFRAVFGKEQPGRVICYGRVVTTSSLKKYEEITKLKQQHANEITSLKEEVKEMIKEEIRSFFSQLVKNNPGLDFHDIQRCVGSNIPSPVDASSARAMRGHNLPHSSCDDLKDPATRPRGAF